MLHDALSNRRRTATSNAPDLRRMLTQNLDKRRKYGKRPELSNFSTRKVLASERIGPLRAEISPPATSDSTLDHDKGKALDPRRMLTHSSASKPTRQEGMNPPKNQLPSHKQWGIRKPKPITKARNRMVQVVDLLRSNCISWSPQAKSLRRRFHRYRTRSEASRAAGNA